MIPKKEYLQQERRKYLRLDSVFPVEFCLVNPTGENFLSEWLQGFTCNVSKGGICLEANNLKLEITELIKQKQARINLKIEMPLNMPPVIARAKIIWVKDVPGQQEKTVIGLGYEVISTAQNMRLMRYAWTKKIFPQAAVAVIIILALFLSIGSYLNVKLIKGNALLVEQLVNIVQESSIAKQKVKRIDKEKSDLRIQIDSLKMQYDALREEKLKLDDKAKLEEEKASERIKELNGLIDKITQEKDLAQEKLLIAQNTENNITEELLRLDKRKADLERVNLKRMYKWLKVHQNPRTGLVASFEGDNNIAQWAFIYDQALAILAYTKFSDFGRARKSLDFFSRKAERRNGEFFNAYYANDGNPAEYVVHSGPNIWLGIAIMQYAKKSCDYSYLQLAEEIAQMIIRLQNEDRDAGIRGGPKEEWFSTEHNLDAYAFFNMLYIMTDKKIYLDARDKALNWLVAHTYDKSEVPVKRGKGDSTIATDTYAWSIAAIGPEKLEELGLKPDRIVEFAEDNCLVEVDYLRPGGKKVKIKGFDFAAARNIARGGVVSSEWTAQMILSLRIMADFFYKKGMVAKARSYEARADEYLSSLENMIISSPSASGQGAVCLPYATEEFVDTGHGWMTPKGKSTGSVAGTVYTLFAYHKFNPLEF